jgi:hypothetical protein
MSFPALPSAMRRRPIRSWFPATLLGDGPTSSRIANGVAWVVLVAFATYLPIAGAHAGDAHAYWAADLWDPYTTAVNQDDAYLYSPAFLLAIGPLKLLPFEAFFVVFTALNLAVLAWTVGPVIAALVLLPIGFSPAFVDLWYGNIGILMAAALVLVFRHPAGWSFLLLTKVTPGVGLAWFLARHEWRYVAMALLITLAIAAISFVITPAAWFEWPRHLAESAALPEIFPLPPLWLRLLAAVAIAGGGGLLSQRWTVVVAALLAQPVFWFTGFSMLLAWVGLVRHRRKLLLTSVIE